METLIPFPPETFHTFEKKSESITEYHTTKDELNDSVFFNTTVENFTGKSTAKEESFLLNRVQDVEPENISHHSIEENSILKETAEQSSVACCQEVLKCDKELLKLQREKAQISYLLKCIPLLRENFTVHRKIGEGTFSSVFLATVKGNDHENYAVKHLVPTCHPSRIEKELRCLMDIGGKDNVVGVDLCLRSGLNVAFVMPFLPHSRFCDYFGSMDMDETKLYMKNLLIALRRVHSFGIIHRDVKPSNFLYDRVGKRFLLVDFGLAHDVGDSGNKELSTSVFLSPKKRKRSEEQPDDENTMSRKIHCNASVNGSPRRPLQSISKFHERGQNIPSKNLIASPTRRPLGNYQGSNIKFPTPPPNPTKRMTAPIPTGEFRMLEPKQKCGGGLVIRVQNSKVVSAPVSSPAPIARTGSHRRPLFTPDPPKRLVTTLSTLAPPPTPPLPPPSPKLLSSSSSSSMTQMSTPTSKGCSCQALARVCRFCLSKRPYFAPRAGTPGFRPPEVLLKSHQQTTAVDMWAAGVILLCIASGCYPFFRSPDDITALAEIMTVFGTTRLENVATKLGRRVISSNRRPAMDLKILCGKLRSRGCKDVPKEPLPNDAYDLLSRLLDLDPDTRITAEDALQHPFFIDTS